MKKIILPIIAALLPLLSGGCSKSAATHSEAERDGVYGYWQIVEDGEAESIIVVYKSGETSYAKMVAIYDNGKLSETIEQPVEKSKGLKGNPYLCGLDFIYNLVQGDNGKLKGKVADPDSGEIYDCEVWLDSKTGKLVVRGEFLCFGKNEYWPAIDENAVPKSARIDILEAKPNIPKE